MSAEIRVGLEIHQMLDTGAKLFCDCPTIIRHDEPHLTFRRWLRLAKSELGEIDPAALFEYSKGRIYCYEGYNDTVCLVEMDEEPPHPLNREALETALLIALMLNCKIVDEVHVMRKIVIDGSNTTGFQRTALVGFGGYLEVNGKRITVSTVCLEEDAARKMGEDEKSVVYRLDRLGIPLVEIATAPEISSPEEAGMVARRIGQLLRMTGRVKRGLGTIRQDLNVSVKGGARVEIKGVQELELIPRIVELEVQRQLELIKISWELKSRGVTPESIREEVVDVTSVFKETESKVASRVLGAGGVALAVRLPGFRGLIGREVAPGRRLGTEMAERARYWADVGGIFHSDELPRYGISSQEVDAVKSALGCGADDAFVLVFEEREKALKALKAVVERAREAVLGVPEETRGANPDGTTRFLRPMPGKARMYPETDIRPIPVTPELLDKLRSLIPEPPERKYEILVREHGLSEELARRLLWSTRLDLYERVVSEIKAPPVLVASTLENTLVDLRRRGIPVHQLDDSHLVGVFKLYADGVVAKEAIPALLEYLANNPSATPEDAVKKLGLGGVSVEEARRVVREVIASLEDEIRRRGGKAFGLVMGRAMERLRGRVDGAVLSEIVKEELRAYPEPSGA